MAELKKIKDRLVLDYMARDYDSIMESMYAVIPDIMPEWKDYRNEADFGNVLLQLFAHTADMISYYQDRIANESFLTTAQSRASVINHLKLIGYTMATAAAASVSLKMFFTSNEFDAVVIKKDDAFSVKSSDNGSTIRFEYTNDTDLTIKGDQLKEEMSKDLYGNELRLFTFEGVPVEEGRRVKSEIIGISDGTSNQKFMLGHPGLLMKSRGDDRRSSQDVVIVSDKGPSRLQWSQKEYLLYCNATNRGFTIDIDEFDRATILFGDGVYGAIPPCDAKLSASYRIGGGIKGNIPPGQQWTFESTGLKNAPLAKIVNIQAAVGGAPRESIEHAVKHAPGIFRSRKRAVTEEDYKELALNFNGVGKVRAKAANCTTVNLYVAPQGGGYVTDTLEADLLTYFEEKRPVSTRIRIIDVTYIPVFVSVSIRVESYYLESEIVEKVRASGKMLLDFNNVDFGQVIYISKFYEAIENIDGVANVVVKEFSVGYSMEKCLPENRISKLMDGVIKLADHQIPAIPLVSEYAQGIKVVLESGEYV